MAGKYLTRFVLLAVLVPAAGCQGLALPRAVVHSTVVGRQDRPAPRRSAPPLVAQPAADAQITAGRLPAVYHVPPREKEMVSLPTYVVEPPDILLVEAVRLVPKPPYKVQPLDVLQVVVLGTVIGEEINGLFPVSAGGRIELGASYGSVEVAGQTIVEATATIERFLRGRLRQPQVSVALAQTAGQQQIVGEHIVGPDGRVNLGSYGSVYVSGLTLAETRAAIERHLSQFLADPKVSVDVFAYNSKVYYIVLSGAGFGDQIIRTPVTGNETVLDAISQVGLPRTSSKRIWIARPAPGKAPCDQILPVKWNDIVEGASTATNYQIFPGDRVYVAEDRLVALDSFVQKLTAPVERMFGFTLLGVQTIQTINRFPNGLRSTF